MTTLDRRIEALERRAGEVSPVFVVHWRWRDENGREHIEPPVPEGATVLELRWPEEVGDGPQIARG